MLLTPVLLLCCDWCRSAIFSFCPLSSTLPRSHHPSRTRWHGRYTFCWRGTDSAAVHMAADVAQLASKVWLSQPFSLLLEIMNVHSSLFWSVGWLGGRLIGWSVCGSLWAEGDQSLRDSISATCKCTHFKGLQIVSADAGDSPEVSGKTQHSGIRNTRNLALFAQGWFTAWGKEAACVASR